MKKHIDCRNRKNPLAEISRLFNGPRLSHIRVLTDNDQDADLISRFLAQKGFEVGVDTNGIDFWIEGDLGPENFIQPPTADEMACSGTVILISKPYMGETEDDLGKRLIREFITRLNPQNPGSIVLIHRGVQLQTDHRDVLDSAMKKGWEILVSRTSLTHFKMNPACIAGRAAEMSLISSALEQAHKIIPL